jgi:hypothetical protein
VAVLSSIGKIFLVKNKKRSTDRIVGRRKSVLQSVVQGDSDLSEYYCVLTDFSLVCPKCLINLMVAKFMGNLKQEEK